MSSLLSNYDALTGLFNRRALHAILSNSVEDNSQIALLLCDVDRFKDLNEIFGYVRGDEELCRIARALERVCAPSPVFRIGGDEFAVVLQEVSAQQALEIADKILASQPPQSIPMRGVAPIETLSLSIGIALFPLQALNDENLLWAADIALLKAKRGGRLPDGTPYVGRNRAMVWGDFLDEFSDQSAQFLNPDFRPPQD